LQGCSYGSTVVLLQANLKFSEGKREKGEKAAAAAERSLVPPPLPLEKLAQKCATLRVDPTKLDLNLNLDEKRLWNASMSSNAQE
jgi:hypothetical protein